jgi:hypothetical protein
VKWLRHTHVSWQFDTAEGQRYGVLYQAAGQPPGPTATLTIRAGAAAREVGRVLRSANGAELIVPASTGVFGDRSLDFQSRLSAAIRNWIAGPN